MPVLVAIGAFDPYAPEALVRAGLSGLTRMTLIVDPAGAHNVIPRTPCIDDIRTEWFNNPTGAPREDCLRSQLLRWDLP